MIRNFKAIGLALVAVFALSAVAASTASANTAFDFTSDGDFTTLKGTQSSETDVFTTTAGEVKCSHASYHGSTTSTSTTTITVKPTYTGCKVSGITATIDTKTCGYTFNAVTKDANGTYTGDVSIECSTAGDSITVTASLFGTVKCTVHVPEQTINGITYKAIANGDVEAIVNSSGVTYTHTSGTGFGACNGAGSTVQHDGTYVGAGSIEGINESGNPTDIGLGDT